MEHSSRYYKTRTAVRAVFYTSVVSFIYGICMLDITWFFK